MRNSKSATKSWFKLSMSVACACFVGQVSIVGSLPLADLSAQELDQQTAQPKIDLDKLLLLVSRNPAPDQFYATISSADLTVHPFNRTKERQVINAGGNAETIGYINLAIGKQRLAKGDYDEALQYFLVSRRRLPKNKLPVLELLSLYENSGDLDEFFKVCQDGLEDNPNTIEILEKRFFAFVNLGQFEKASEDAERIKRLAPQKSLGYFLSAFLQAGAPSKPIRNPSNALSNANRAIRLSDNQTPILFHVLAMANASSGNWKEAISEQSKAVDISSNVQRPFMLTWLQNFKDEIPRTFEKISDAPKTLSKADRFRQLTKMIQDQMVLIKGGNFQMGSQRTGSFADESPVHEVELNPFYLSKFEVTNRIYELVMQGEVRGLTNPNLPVESVSREDCLLFLKRLNTLAGAEVFRLPTEAEWEFSARSGSKTLYHFSNDPEGLSVFAWYQENAIAGSRKVGTKKANSLGLFDMYGNVAEWCNDRYNAYKDEKIVNPMGPKTGKLFVYRGGNWANSAAQCTSTARGICPDSERRKGIGFRLAMDATGPIDLEFTLDAKPAIDSGDPNSTKRTNSTSKNLDKLISEVRKVGRSSPEATLCVERLVDRGIQLYRKGEIEKSRDDFEVALEIMPRQLVVDYGLMTHSFLAWIHATSMDESIRDDAKAIEYARTACAISRYKKWHTLHVLAAAHGEAGEFDLAINAAKAAIELSPPKARPVCEKQLELLKSRSKIRSRNFFEPISQ